MTERDDDFFDRWGGDGEQALAILDHCTVPPSAEVFDYGLERVRGRAKAAISVQRYARTLADNYEQTTFDPPAKCEHELWLVGRTARRKKDVKVCPVCDCADFMPVVSEFKNL